MKVPKLSHAVLLILFTLFVGIGSVYTIVHLPDQSLSQKDDRVEDATEQPTTGIVDINATPISGYLSKINYPKLSGVADAVVEEKINKRILEIIQGLVIEYDHRFDKYQEALQARDLYLDGNKLIGGGFINIRYEIEQPSFAPILSVQFWRDWDMTMAHPANDIHNLLFDLRNGTELTLSDFFSDLNYEVELNYQPNADYNQNSPNPNEELGAMTKNISSFSHVMVAEDGLRVTLDYYELGGRPYGQPEFLIPWDELQPAIDPEGLLAKFIE